MQWRIAEVCQRLEHDLKVLGVTAIEDRLQVNIVTVVALKNESVASYLKCFLVAIG